MIVIDLSQGWNENEVNKLIDNLPVNTKDKEQMRAQNHCISEDNPELLEQDNG